MFPNHAVQLCATLHHRVQLRADGGVEEVGAKGQYGQAGVWEEAQYGFRLCLFGGRYLGLVLVDGCARVCVGRTSSVPLRYGASGLRALFRVGGARDGHWLVRLRTTQVRPGPP